MTMDREPLQPIDPTLDCATDQFQIYSSYRARVEYQTTQPILFLLTRLLKYISRMNIKRVFKHHYYPYEKWIGILLYTIFIILQLSSLESRFILVIPLDLIFVTPQ